MLYLKKALLLGIFRKQPLDGKAGTLTDEQLLVRYRLEQDPEVIGILYTRYTHLVLGTCLKYLEDMDHARDAVMEIFEGLFRSLATSDVRHFSSWLYQVSRNHCLMKLRGRESYLRMMEVIRRDTDGGDMEFTEDVHLNTDEESKKMELVMDALNGLKPEQRSCVELMYLEGRSYQEISALTGFSMKEVKSHIQNGKRNLRISVEKALGIPLILILLHYLLSL